MRARTIAIIVAALIAIAVLALTPPDHAVAAEPEPAPARIDNPHLIFAAWYTDPVNAAWYRWVVWMQDPVNAAWFHQQTDAGCGGWRHLIAQHFPAGQVGTACRVLMCESGGNPTAENPRSTASGLAQFLDSTWRNARGAHPDGARYARASHAPAPVQIAVYGAWWARTSWGQWVCH